jgi:hypothetical protein
MTADVGTQERGRFGALFLAYTPLVDTAYLTSMRMTCSLTPAISELVMGTMASPTIISHAWKIHGRRHVHGMGFWPPDAPASRGVLAGVSSREIQTLYAYHRNTVYFATRRSGTG